MPDSTVEPPFYSEWMLCEACHYSWLRDPTRAIPTRCPECRAPWPTVIEMPSVR